MPSDVMRSLGVTYLYLWPSDPKWRTGPSDHHRPVTAPRLGDRTLSGVIGYSLPVLCPSDQARHGRAVQQVWRGVNSLQPAGRWRAGGITAVMPAIIGVVTRMAGILRAVAPQGEREYPSRNGRLFHQNDHTRRRIERLIPYGDPAHGDVTAEEETILGRGRAALPSFGLGHPVIALRR